MASLVNARSSDTDPTQAASTRSPEAVTVSCVSSSPGRVVALLSLLNLVNYIDRYVLASVLPRVKAELFLTDAESGWLQTSFLVGYLVASPVFAILSRRIERRTLLAVGVFIFGLATVASGYARGFWSLLAMRAIVGVGEASYSALAPTFIDENVAPASRGRALAAFFVMAPIGAALGFVIGAQVERVLGWRQSFLVTGLPAILLAVTSLALPEPAKETGESRSAVDDVRRLFREPLYRLNAIAYTAFTFTIGGFSYWAPTFVSRELGVSIAKASSAFGAAAGLGGLLGSVIGGVVYDRRQRHATDARPDLRVGLEICAYTTLAGVPFVAGAFILHNATAFYGLVTPALILLFCSNAPVNAVIMRSAPPILRPQALGVTISAIHLFGDLWSPPLIGFVSDQTGSLRAACAIFPLALVLAGFVWLHALRLSERLNAESAALK